MFRRIYLYIVAFISLEAVVWGTIGAVRSLTVSGPGGDVANLASMLSLALVSLPIFWIDWRLIRSDLHHNVDERASTTRAIFLYGTLLVSLAGALLNGLALLCQVFFEAANISLDLVFIRGQRAVLANIFAILVNLAAAGFFLVVLRGDWQALSFSGEYTPAMARSLTRARRLYRYGWLIFSLALSLSGATLLLQVGLKAWLPLSEISKAELANGLALLLVGLPSLIFFTLLIRHSLQEAVEKNSVMRLVVLYFLIFFGVTGVLISVHQVLNKLLRFLLAGESASAQVLNSISSPLALAMTLGATWFFFFRQLQVEIKQRIATEVQRESPRITIPTTLPLSTRLRDANLQRLYDYGMAFMGLGAGFAGLQALFGYLLYLLLGYPWLGPGMRITLSYALSLLVVGFPLWFSAWRPIQRGTLQEGRAGELARRSLIRQGYLYLVLLISLVGGMFTGGSALFSITSQLVGTTQPDFLAQMLVQCKTALGFWLIFYLHLRLLRSDQLMSNRVLTRRQAQFPVLVLASESVGEASANTPVDDFAVQMVHALQQQAPAVPVAIHPYSLGAPDDNLSLARAVILPAGLLVKSSEAMRLWLQTFPGTRLVIGDFNSGAVPSPDWRWITGRAFSVSELARQAAIAIRRLAEEEY